jgi:hypothetical protein
LGLANAGGAAVIIRNKDTTQRTRLGKNIGTSSKGVSGVRRSCCSKCGVPFRMPEK